MSRAWRTMPQDKRDFDTACDHRLREQENKKEDTLFLCTLCSALVALIMVLAIAATMNVSFVVQTVRAERLPDDPYERAVALLTDYPVIDGYVSCSGIIYVVVVVNNENIWFKPS